MLGEAVLKKVWVEIGEFSGFWCFGAKLTIFDRVSRAEATAVARFDNVEL